MARQKRFIVVNRSWTRTPQDIEDAINTLEADQRILAFLPTGIGYLIVVERVSGKKTK